MKKILIYINEKQLKPIGGYRGYNYNLMLDLKNDKDFEIYFLNDMSVRQKYHKYYELLPNFIKKIHRSKQNLRDCKYLISNTPKNAKIDLNCYDAIHFHSTFDLYGCKDSLDNYGGKVILTSHSPKPMHLEKIEDGISERDRNRYYEYYKQLEKVDEYAFLRADFIVFPCKEAEEPYKNQWRRFEKIRELKKDSIRYMLSGVKKADIKIPQNEVRSKLGIPADAFVIAYAGRHNEVKGYDIFREYAISYLKKNEEIYVICAGKEGPLYGPNHPRWIEIGWTNDPHSIINAANVFVLPNRETYFDLVLLEVLSIGTPIIASYTGGNKYFEQYGNRGIMLYNSFEEFEKLLDKVISWEKKEYDTIRIENISLFDEIFTTHAFANRYKELLKTIL